jgi:hypothetical protein
MKALTKAIVLSGILSVASCVVAAQTQSSAVVSLGASKSFMHVGSLAGHPLSATVESVHVQTLADGTHIQTKGKSLEYRDSQGRIRSDNYSSMGMDKDYSETPYDIEIFDPVAGFIYHLQPQNNTAVRSQIARASSSAPYTQNPGVTTRAEASARPQVQRPAVERLGTQDFDGIKAIGTRLTRTIPIGAQGNDQPMTNTTESWRSAELGLTLLQKTSDSRNGDMEWRMTNIVQSEPDPSLFEVPADYTIKDQ